MANYTTLQSLFSAIANAIRGQDGSAGAIFAYDFPARISAIQTQDHTIEDSIVDGSLTTYTNDRIKQIRPYAFYAFNSLQKVNCAEVTRVKASAFTDCLYLTKARFPKATHFDRYAFAGSQRLQYVEMYGSAENLGAISQDVFDHAFDLETLVIRSTEGVCYLDPSAFLLSSIAQGTGYIYVPRALIEDYKAAENWSTYASQFRALEDYTVDGTVTGDLDESKI